MASLIKNQIVKHLSVFARNIKPEQINVEVLRGKGELRGIILNEEVLSEKLELPSWLRIKHASCNRVTVKIPWTKLKSRPVELHVDEIHVTLELCADKADEFKNRSANKSNGYGFGDIVVEGLSIFVNTVEIEFTSTRFRGSVMLSRLDVQSVTPRWETTKDLKETRFSDHATQKIMNFKCVSWQLLRIEARAIETNSDGSDVRKGFSSPLRLITNNGKCRISIKKSHVDGSLICGRMQTILEEVLWIVTLPQLRSAISFGKHILELIKKSAEHANNLNKVTKSINFAKTISERDRGMSPNFARIDFNQSSNHFYVTKMDLHLYDDGSELDFPQDWNIDNGAIQLVLSRVSVDVYPNHAPLWKRTDWVGYDTTNSCATEAEKLVAMHLTSISDNLGEKDRKHFVNVCQELRSQNIVIRINDLLLYRVSQQSSKKESLIPLIHADNTARQALPHHTSIFHMEVVNYYYLNPTNFPVPRNVTHIMIGPLNVCVEPRSVRWLVYVFENISNLVDLKTVAEESDPSDRKIELILPKIIFEVPTYEDDDRFPTRFVASFCTITASNYFYESTQIAEANAFKNFVDKSVSYVQSFSKRLVTHVNNGKDLLLLNGQSDNSFFLIKCASFTLHSELNNSSCHYPMSNAFSFNIYVVDEKESRTLISVDQLNTVQIAIDHFQFTQINQLQKIMSELAERIKRDREFFCQRYSHLVNQTNLLIYALIDRIIVNIVLPSTPIPSIYSRNTQPNIPSSETDEFLSSTSSAHLSNALNLVQVNSACTIGKQNSSTLNAASPLPQTFFPIVNDLNQLETGADSLIEGSEYSGLDGRDELYEETASIITTISDEEVQLQVAYLEEGSGTASAIGIYDDFFKSPVPVAEEAIFVEENVQSIRETNRYLLQVANTLEVQLSDTNVVVSVKKDDINADGYVTSVNVDERIKIRCGDIIRPNNVVIGDKAVIQKDREPDEEVKFRLVGHSGRTCLKVGLHELNIELSDIIVSHLGPFFQVNMPSEENFQLEVALRNSAVKIKNPKKSKPLKLIINQLNFEDGDYPTANDK